MAAVLLQILYHLSPGIATDPGRRFAPGAGVCYNKKTGEAPLE